MANQESQFSSVLNQNYATNFGAQSQILQNLTNQFTPIAEAGPDQQGWGAQETAAVNTQIGEGVGQNYGKASQALNNQLAAQGGGNQVLPSGASAALKGQLASSAANQLSQQQLAATTANYSQGRQNWQQATSGLNALAGEYNPNAIAGEASGANSSAFGEQTQVQTMKNQKEQAIAGGIASLALAPFTGGASLGMGALSMPSFGGSNSGGGGDGQLPSGLNAGNGLYGAGFGSGQSMTSLQP